ncbi:MAG TPA: hypothetical protein VFZ69_10255 [Longimicrobiales bacterium]
MPAVRYLLLCALTAASTFGESRPRPRPDHATADLAAAPSSVRRPLPFFYDLYTFRGREGRTAIVTSYAVDAGDLETETVDGRVRYRFSVTLVLADAARRSVWGTHDTVHVDVPRALPSGHLLYTHVEVLAPPSRTTQQRVIMTDATEPGIGQLYRESYPIPDYSGSELMLSDVALGQPEASGSGWRRGDVSLALLPTSQFPSSTFDVFYEIYNLPAGHAYTTEIAIEEIGRPGRAVRTRPIRLSFAGEAGAGVSGALPELRRVETSLRKGSYRITVTITDRVTGATASRSRTFDVRGSGRGTTMVAALPDRNGG